MLLFGSAMVLIMLYRPHGLWPVPKHGVRPDGYGRAAAAGPTSRHLAAERRMSRARAAPARHAARAWRRRCSGKLRTGIAGRHPVGRNVSKRFGGLQALSDVGLEIRRRPDLRPDRPQRRRQDDILQRDHRPLLRPTPESFLLEGKRVRAVGRAQGCRSGDRPHVPEHPAVRRHDGDGERHGGSARAHPIRCHRRGAQAQERTPGGGLDPASRAGTAGVRRHPAVRRLPGPHPLLWRPAPPRDRARARDRSQAAGARRTGSRHERHRKDRPARPAVGDRQGRQDDPADRARRQAGHGPVRPRHRPRLWQADRRRATRGGPAESGRHRGLSRRRPWCASRPRSASPQAADTGVVAGTRPGNRQAADDARSQGTEGLLRRHPGRQGRRHRCRAGRAGRADRCQRRGQDHDAQGDHRRAPGQRRLDPVYRRADTGAWARINWSPGASPWCRKAAACSRA